MLHTKRAYQAYNTSDGYRVLVDRLWPRGITKDKAHIDCWLKEIAPSAQLRKWFAHDPGKWEEFKKRYREELKDSVALPELVKIIKEKKVVTLVYAAKDEVHNNAALLEEILSIKM
ncbi:MAG: DUF488 family protein [Bacteroidetes bacterium]|nr:DUF488 family protein [Bacteroidota bacterium]MBS1756479.1 DUF488 family protein [Bacteroidota bacterium]